MKRIISLLISLIMLVSCMGISGLNAFAFVPDSIVATVDGSESEDIEVSADSADASDFGFSQDACDCLLTYTGSKTVTDWEISGITEGTEYKVIVKTERLLELAVNNGVQSVTVNAVTADRVMAHTVDIYENACDTPSNDFSVIYHGRITGYRIGDLFGLDEETVNKCVFYEVYYNGDNDLKSWSFGGMTENEDYYLIDSDSTAATFLVKTTYTGTVAIETTVECRHDWVAGDTLKEPTCAEEGSRQYECSKCGDKKTEPIPKSTYHDWGDGVVTTPPTCGDEGVVIYTCTVCFATTTGTVPATGEHTWDDGVITTQPTCSEEGVRTYTCTVCNKATRTESVEPSDDKHIWGRKELVQAPTCVKNGVYNLYCTYCGEVKKEVSPKSDQHVVVKDAAVAATFKADGKTAGSHCSLCNKVLVEQKVIPMLTGTEFTKLTRGKKSFTAKWTKSVGVDGYQIKYSLKKNMKNAKTVTVKGAKNIKRTIKDLKKKKKYYVRIRAYKTIKGKKQYSEWSAKKAVKTK